MGCNLKTKDMSCLYTIHPLTTQQGESRLNFKVIWHDLLKDRCFNLEIRKEGSLRPVIYSTLSGKDLFIRRDVYDFHPFSLCIAQPAGKVKAIPKISSEANIPSDELRKYLDSLSPTRFKRKSAFLSEIKRLHEKIHSDIFYGARYLNDHYFPLSF